MKYLFIILVLCIAASSSMAQTAHSLNIKGDKAYDKNNFATAEENYLKSYNDKSAYQSKYNLGNSLFKQDRYEEAIEAFDQATGMASQESERADSYYNLGTAQLKHVTEDPEVLDKAIASLKKAIKYDPTNEEAKQNLFKAQVMKRIQQKQQEEQQQQEQSQDPNQDQEPQENQDQEQQESEKQEEQDPSEQEQQEKEQQEDQENPADSSSQSSKVDTMSLEDLSKEEAERLLRIVEQEEKKIQDRLKRQQSNRNRPEKDW